MTDPYRNRIEPIRFASLFAGSFLAIVLVAIGLFSLAPGHVWEAFGIAVAILWLASCPVWWYRYEAMRRFEDEMADQP